MKKENRIPKKIVQKILDTVACGLVKGVGSPEPGKMCVEAAVCYAYGLPHGDNPPCVGAAVRSFKITLNDCDWSSDAARAKGLRRIAVAQLGSESINQQAFAKGLALKVIQKGLPVTLRRLAGLVPSHAEALEASAKGCEASTDLTSAAWSAESAASAASAAARSAAWSAESAVKDTVLTQFSELAVQVLIDLKSPGCEWLHLCD